MKIKMALRSKVEALTKDLIRTTTGFEENEENFHISYEFAASNFKYHKFLDTDAHKVKRIVEGMREKFLIHSQDEKATMLMKSYESFLKDPLFEGKESGFTETHFAVLRFLFLLADSPTKPGYEKLTPPPVDVLQDEFDWVAYLREDDIPVAPFVDDFTSSTSEDDDSYDEETTVPSSISNIPLSSKCEKSTGLGTSRFGSHIDSESFGSKTWLYENLMTRYWLGESSQAEASLSRSSNLIYDWDRYESQLNPLYAPKYKAYVTEYQIIREIIWLLIGTKDLFVFKWNGYNYHPNEAVCVGHLTENALARFLDHIAYYGNIVNKFSQFVDLVASGSSCHGSEAGSSQSASTCLTYQAFGSALFCFLRQLRRRLVDMEKNICKQDETVTMSSVEKDLASIFQALRLVDTIFVDGIKSCDHSTNQSQKALTLLSVLYQMLNDFDRQNFEERKFVSLLLFFWIKTCRPYIETIDGWMFRGLLIDPSNEFIIQRNKDVQSSNENFWDEAFSFAYDLTAFGGCDKKLQNPNEEIPSSTSPVLEKMDKASGFLLPVIREIVLTGKSMELLKSLGRIRDVVGVENYDSFLYSKYVKDIEDQFFSSQLDNQQLQRGEDCVAMSTVAVGDAFSDRVKQQLLESSALDPLLQHNFEQLFDIGNHRTLSDEDESDCFGWFSACDSPVLVPLQWTLQTCLYSHLISQYRLVSSMLLRILKQDYKLLDYFAAIRRFYLMEAGGPLYEFYTTIFDQIRLAKAWKDVSFVNTVLQEALQLHHHHDRERVFLYFREDEGKAVSHLNDSLDDIVLHYKISWPIDIVITSRHMKIYNQVFLFLLQIKHAKYILDRLRFSDLDNLSLSESPNNDLDVTFEPKFESGFVHRLHLFRMRLLHFVNSLHDYIMTRILHSVGIEFQKEMDLAADLDDIISTHNVYVQRVHELCLLHRKVSLLRDAIVEVLSFAKTVERLWNNDCGPTRGKILYDTEYRFMCCIIFLSSMIQKVTARGTFPHLESLAFALVTCSESLRQTR